MSHTNSTAEAFARAAVRQLRGIVDVPPYEIPRKQLPPSELPHGWQGPHKRLGKAVRRKEGKR